jgi:hypothetical protein
VTGARARTGGFRRVAVAVFFDLVFVDLVAFFRPPPTDCDSARGSPYGRIVSCGPTRDESSDICIGLHCDRSGDESRGIFVCA